MNMDESQMAQECAKQGRGLERRGGETFLPNAVISKIVKSRTRYLIPEPLLSQTESIIVFIIVVPRVALPLSSQAKFCGETDSTENLSYLFETIKNEEKRGERGN